MFSNLKKYFTFSRTERNGAFVLISIIFILILIYFFSPYFFKSDKTDFSDFKNEVDKFIASKKADSIGDSAETKNTYLTEDDLPLKRNLFYFNPNNLPVEKWKQLGLTDKQIKVIKNYEAKGGKFYKKEDVKKMYCIKENEYKILEPYIEIPENKEKKEFTKTAKFEKNKNIVELNSADSIELTTLKGIGSSFANRIIKYRNLLGGFYKKEQLLEVWGLDSAKYFQFSDFVTVNSSSIKKTNMNTATFDELRKHPYIGYNLAKVISNYKKQHGNYKSVSDIKKIAVVDEKLFLKVCNYLRVE